MKFHEWFSELNFGMSLSFELNFRLKWGKVYWSRRRRRLLRELRLRRRRRRIHLKCTYKHRSAKGSENEYATFDMRYRKLGFRICDLRIRKSFIEILICDLRIRKSFIEISICDLRIRRSILKFEYATCDFDQIRICDLRIRRSHIKNLNLRLATKFPTFNDIFPLLSTEFLFNCDWKLKNMYSNWKMIGFIQF